MPKLKVSAETLWAQKLKNGIWFHHQGQTHWLKAETGTKARSAQESEKGHEILAPMPGKVTKILRQAGDQVATSDAVIVMEAMKMEYSLKFARPGKIAEIRVQTGQQVALGELLASLKEDA